MTEDEHQFAIFVEDEKGPMFRQFCTEVEQARRRAQELANLEGLPFLIFSFKEVRQVGRFKPAAKPSAA